MKAPDFWRSPESGTARLLSPLGQVYRMAGRLRRVIVTPYRSRIPVICVGNIVAGGAGKTPTALALAALLKRQGANPVFVSRGYGGIEKGPLRVDPDRHTFRDVGDEALLLARTAPCWIGRDRAAAVRAAEPYASHIILDDGLQNPTVAPSLNLLVIDGETGLGNGRLIPAGPLRETLADALLRVDAIVMIGEDLCGLQEKIARWNSPPLAGRVRERGAPLGIDSIIQDTPQLFAPLPNPPREGEGIRPCIPVYRASFQTRLPDDFPKDRAYFAFAGIGRPEKFFASCRLAGLNLNGTRSFPDHHAFTVKELGALADHARTRNLQLITTTKDVVRLPKDFCNQGSVLPVELVVEDEEFMEQFLNKGMS